MDTTTYAESDNISIDLIRESPTKTAVILNGGEIVEINNKQKFRVLVEIDQKHKRYYPNRLSFKKIHAVFGAESSHWIGKIIKFSVETHDNRELIIANPQVPQEPKPMRNEG